MSDSSRLAATVTGKMEAGNFKAAIWIVCSEDKPAPDTHETLNALEAKHPGPAPDQRTPCDPRGNSRFQPVQVSNTDVHKALRSFPAGSSGGPDGLTPQYILDLLTGATDNSLVRWRLRFSSDADIVRLTNARIIIIIIIVP